MSESPRHHAASTSAAATRSAALSELGVQLEWRESKFGPGERAFLDRVLLRFELEPQKVIGDVIVSRQRREVETVARAAAAYADAPMGNRRRAVADAIGYSVWGADKLIRDAKSRGFLADGELTDRGREVLESVELAAVAR